jgi:glycosyltransferase involved in cell wall biosynthesis
MESGFCAAQTCPLAVPLLASRPGTMANRLKILLSAYACEPGRGSEPEVGWQWAIHLARLHDVTVLTRSNNRQPIERGLASLPPPHPQFLYFDLSERWQHWKRRGLPVALYYFQWQRTAARFVAPRMTEFDVIHHLTFNSFRQPGHWRSCGKPIILGPLGGGQICPWRLMGDFGAAMPGEFFRSATVKLNVLNPFARASFRDASVILCANQDTAERVPAAFQSKVRMMLETGMPETAATTPATRVNDGLVRVIWVSRLVPIKGAPLALRAFALAHKQRPQLRLTLVGDGPDTAKARSLATRLGVEGAVEWTGRVSLDGVKALLPKHDIFMFTSLRDTSGNVLLEAMAAGLPAVTLRHHGAAQIATDETALRIIPTNLRDTASGMGRALVQLADDNPLRARLGHAALQRIKNVYTWSNKAAEMDLIYRSVLS